MSRTLKELRQKRQGRHGAHDLRRRTASERLAVAALAIGGIMADASVGLVGYTVGERRHMWARATIHAATVARRCHPRPGEADALRLVTLAVALAAPSTGAAAPVGV